MIKLLFPSTFAGIGEKINTVVNYKAALATLGEGISGEKKFTSALGEAFTYAFTGQDMTPDENEIDDGSGTSDSIDDDEEQTGEADEVAAFSQEEETAEQEDDTEVSTAGENFADAVIAAFMEDQGQYSDFDIPAGVTYGMPGILIDYTTPLSGVVSSSFGYREHPLEGDVRFHYGTDVAAESGTKIKAFADGKVIAVGSSESLGNYVILRHGDIETQYGHCSQVFVENGQAVKMGQAIASVGMTGDATNPHLHFELKVNGVYVNPEYYLLWQ